MKIVIAPDSFKESISAPAAAEAIARGVKAAIPGAQTVCVPMADGGEGTVEAVLAAASGEARMQTVNDALGHKVDAVWGMLADGTAVIEMAAASGLELIAPARRDPMRASSHGVGELILAALDAGARHIILGLGGSATNDAGAGMLTALGARLLDAEGHSLPPGGGALARIASIDIHGLDPRLAGARIDVASDVDNPLCGPQGASHVFGPQKGATPAQVHELDQALERFADICARSLGSTIAMRPARAPRAAWASRPRHSWTRAFAPAWTSWPSWADWRKPWRRHAGVHRRRPDGCADAARQDAGRRRPDRPAGVPVVALAGSLGEGYEACTPAASARRSASRPAPSRCSRRSTTPNACCTIARAT